MRSSRNVGLSRAEALSPRPDAPEGARVTLRIFDWRGKPSIHYLAGAAAHDLHEQLRRIEEAA